MAEPVRVGSLLDTWPELRAQLAAERLLAAWPGIAGPAAGRTRAERVASGVFHVAVDGSGWLHRLGFEEPTLLARCREIADVHAIHFHLASHEPGIPGADSPEPAPPGAEAGPRSSPGPTGRTRS